ncbi:MAG: hypothetical protein AAF903_07725 [Pseudomonadota bacterium]
MNDEQSVRDLGSNRVTHAQYRETINADKRRETRRKKGEAKLGDVELSNPLFKNTFSLLEKMGVFRIKSDRVEPEITQKDLSLKRPRQNP